MDTNTILLSTLTALIGAVSGTFLGAYLINRKNESKIKKVRKIAIKGLKVIEKYAKNKRAYSNAKDDFNNTLNIAEKRAILVCLHKLGVPIEMPVGNTFEIKNIQFLSNPIDKDEIEDMKIQIDKGHCDHLFYIDVDTYFKGNVKIKTLRSIGKKFVNEVLNESIYNKEQNLLTYPEGWVDNFSYSEYKLLRVFCLQIGSTYYYFDQQKGQPNKERIEQLLKEIDNGLWDGYLDWDYSAYQNMLAQKEFAETGINMLRTNPSNNLQNNEQMQENG